ncbi:vascular non-inflammatory molecule 3 [Caerostris darwini]|uniref:Vascular non-inflammatory molecule 3 n=1 Tax=Caerostris darwini TaxID=1538125 RepID=A0AAV4U5S6_9ARAC|nr:vascular non-inflammatory molecule 3 [Caerostris darwini]
MPCRALRPQKLAGLHFSRRTQKQNPTMSPSESPRIYWTDCSVPHTQYWPRLERASKHSLTMAPIVLRIVLLAVVASCSEAHQNYYRAAVYEHARFGTINDTARLIVETNLDYYRRAAEIASQKGADIILYPEYGIFPPAERSRLKDFMETVPDPNKARANPCLEREEFSQRLILRTLSCIARNNSIAIVANMGDLQSCLGTPECPDDGVFHLNTNVVFDKDGTIIYKYHKEHLFYEFGMDLPRKEQVFTFETSFGKFATFICFDVDFKRMSEVGRVTGVDAVLFSTMFLDQAPQMTSIQFWESWALGNNVTMLASNIQIPGYMAVGSGIFHGQDGALVYTFNPDGYSKLIVANVPKRGADPVEPEASITAISENDVWEWKGDGVDVPDVCSRTLLNDSLDITRDYRCMEENMTHYTFKKLTEPDGRVEACNNGVCCFVEYVADSMTENFYLGVFNGTYNHFGRYSWCEEDCVLARCDPLGDKPCATFPMKSKTSFKHIHLKGNFSSEIVYPSVLQSGMRLVPRSVWDHHHHDIKRDIHVDSTEGEDILVVGMKGRCYNRDPPYTR